MESIPNILVVGTRDKAAILRDLPIRLFVRDIGSEAIQCLKKIKIDVLISRWELADFRDGELLKGVAAAKPGILTLVLLKAGDYVREVAARSVGVSAVLPEDVDDDSFRGIICQLVNIAEVPVSEFEPEDERCIAGNLRKQR